MSYRIKDALVFAGLVLLMAYIVGVSLFGFPRL